VLGTEELFEYIDKYQIDLDPRFNDILGRYCLLSSRHLMRTCHRQLAVFAVISVHYLLLLKTQSQIVRSRYLT